MPFAEAPDSRTMCTSTPHRGPEAALTEPVREQREQCLVDDALEVGAIDGVAGDVGKAGQESDDDGQFDRCFRPFGVGRFMHGTAEGHACGITQLGPALLAIASLIRTRDARLTLAVRSAEPRKVGFTKYAVGPLPYIAKFS